MKNPVTSRFLFASSYRRWTLFALVAATLVVGGCAAVATGPEDQVKALATQRWKYLVEGDFDKAYEMATPGFRQIRTLRDYRIRKSSVPVKWLAAEVLRVECTPVGSPTKCVVRVKIDSTPVVPTGFKGVMSSGINETWLFEDGRWWVYESL